MPDINEASRQMQARIDQEEGFSLDGLFETIKDLKATREKKQKQDFEFQKEALNLKATARNAGFDIDYDPQANTLRPVARQAPKPSRITRLPDGGMEMEENFDESGKPTELDPVSKAELLGYESELKAKAKQKYPSGNGATKKPLTEAQRTSIVFGEKVGRLSQELTGLMDKGVDRFTAGQPKSIVTAGKVMSKMGGSLGKTNLEKLNKAERFRDIVDQLKASIPFAKGGKALTGPEKEVLFRLLEYGPNTSDETIKFNINEFVREYKRMAELAKDDRAALSEDELVQMAADDIGGGSTEEQLKKFAEENDLELE